MRVVFMGTPDFAAPSLLALIESPDEVIAVITQPDRPKGRHGTLTPPPVKILATQHNIEVFQPLKIKGKDFFPVLKRLKPDVIIVVAYGQIISKEILDLPPKKCINIHASLLPKYRGPAPINWAIINGETVSGVTSMIVTEGLDSGPILLKKEVAIEEDDNARTLHDKLSKTGGELLTETMKGIREEMLKPAPQDESEATYYPMLKKSDGLIDCSMSAIDIRNRIRGLIPWPGAYIYLGQGARGKGQEVMLKIHKAEVVPSPLTGFMPGWVEGQACPESRSILRQACPEPAVLLRQAQDERVGRRAQDERRRRGEGEIPGTIVDVDDNGILVTTGENYLLIKELQIEGKRRMTAGEFIRGHKIEKGMVLGRDV